MSKTNNLNPLIDFMHHIPNNDDIFNGTQFQNWLALQSQYIQKLWKHQHQNLFGIETTSEWLNELKRSGYANIGLDVVIEILDRNYEGVYDVNATNPDEGSYILSNLEVKQAFKNGIHELENQIKSNEV